MCCDHAVLCLPADDGVTVLVRPELLVRPSASSSSPTFKPPLAVAAAAAAAAASAAKAQKGKLTAFFGRIQGTSSRTTSGQGPARGMREPVAAVRAPLSTQRWLSGRAQRLQRLCFNNRHTTQWNA